jgi:hypothetical protein
MDGISYFKKVQINWGISNPDLACRCISSVLACAVLSCRLRCSTVNVKPEDDGRHYCQVSKKKATDLEKEEAYACPGFRMYQRKVTFLQYAHVSFDLIELNARHGKTSSTPPSVTPIAERAQLPRRC